MKNFKYKRLNEKKDLLSNHKIQMYSSYGEQFSDVPIWTHYRLNDFYNKSTQALGELLRKTKEVQNMDFSEYKDGVAKSKRKQILHDSRKKILDIIEKEIQELNQNVENVENRILDYTKPKEYEDKIENLTSAMRQQEIRSMLRQMPPKERKRFLHESLENDNLDTLHALVNSPDKLINDEELTGIRKQYVLNRNQSLGNALNDAKTLRDVVRAKAASVNSTSLAILRAEGFDDDPCSKQEHFIAFPPRNERSASIARKVILSEQRQQVQDNLKQEFINDNAAIGM
jgi:hypothetical protein